MVRWWRPGWVVGVVLGLCLGGGCCPEPRVSVDGGGGGTWDGGEVPAARLSAIQRALFDRHCVSDCHEFGSAAAGLGLRKGQSHAMLVNRPSQQISSRMRVLPGAPDRSYLVLKLEGGPGIVGDRMPRLAPPRPAAEVQAVRLWISRGAPDD